MKALRRVIPKLQKIFKTRLKEREREENYRAENTREENGVKEKRMRNERRMHLLEIIPAGLLANVYVCLNNYTF